MLIKVHGVFVPLTELRQFPTSSVINALQGTLQLITAAGGHPQATRPPRQGKKKQSKVKTQTGTFGGAIFKVTQAHNGLATLSLVENAFKGAPSFATCKKKGKAGGAAVSSKTLQLLKSSAKGNSAPRASTAQRPSEAPSGRSPTAATER